MRVCSGRRRGRLGPGPCFPLHPTRTSSGKDCDSSLLTGGEGRYALLSFPFATGSRSESSTNPLSSWSQPDESFTATARTTSNTCASPPLGPRTRLCSVRRAVSGCQALREDRCPARHTAPKGVTAQGGPAPVPRSLLPLCFLLALCRRRARVLRRALALEMPAGRGRRRTEGLEPPGSACEEPASSGADSRRTLESKMGCARGWRGLPGEFCPLWVRVVKPCLEPLSGPLELSSCSGREIGRAHV